MYHRNPPLFDMINTKGGSGMIFRAYQDKTIMLGRLGENEARVIRFNVAEILKEHEDASFVINNRRPTDATAYPVGSVYVALADGYLDWTVMSQDLTAEGIGECEIVAYEDETIIKTAIFRTQIERALDNSAEPPDPWESWVQQVAEDADRAEEAAENAESIVLVQDAQPEAEGNKIWMLETPPDSVQVPTYAEHQTKADKVASATSGNFAALDSNGNLTDSGHKDSDYLKSHQDISGKADKVASAVSGNFAALDGNGNLTDSGHKDSDYLTTRAIDDTAGAGETGKTFSADKLTTELGSLKSALNVLEPSASAGDVGKKLKVRTVTDGKVSEYEFGADTVTDVQVNGVSILQNGVANVPVANGTNPGAVKVNSTYGISISDDIIKISGADASKVKAGSTGYNPITPAQQDKSVFYGLSKLAGEDLKNDSVTVGLYPEKSLSAISQMLNAPVSVSGSTPSITAKSGVRYICGECSTLTVVLPASGCVDVVFESGSTATVLTITPPSGVSSVKWANGFDPTSLDANTRYEILIDNGEWGMACTWT